jgi:hypothetical protein
LPHASVAVEPSAWFSGTKIIEMHDDKKAIAPVAHRHQGIERSFEDRAALRDDAAIENRVADVLAVGAEPPCVLDIAVQSRLRGRRSRFPLTGASLWSSPAADCAARSSSISLRSRRSSAAAARSCSSFLIAMARALRISVRNSAIEQQC